ncbi:SgcJ/EcaC family oxidoreductase [Streptomyces sp. 4N509B]|uniref:SgcJ/EcaC family oxidoreductase n=1 Tax=Streptomyces sp. 4N509B TaxID=3457413 RepID=UPI003FD6A678
MMKVLLLGATGYVGSAVADHLTRFGHEVVELGRGAADRPGRGRERRVGDLTDPGSLTRAVTPDIDAVVHAATPTGDAATDAAAVDALLAPLRGTGRAFVYTSGVWVLGATGPDPAGEDAPTDPLPIVGYRPLIERQVLAAAADEVRATVIRPGIVHGRGGGIPALLVNLARDHRAPLFVAPDGEAGGAPVHWPMVHVDDLAELYVAAVERAEAGTLWHGVAEPAVPVRDVARAAGRAADVLAAPRAWPVEEARAALGAAFADALALDQRVAGDAARQRLGWRPARAGAVADLATGSYRTYEVLGSPDAGEDDVRAVAALVAGVEHAQQSELPDAFMSHFRTEDPVWTTAHGRRLAGWEEINAFTHKVLPGAMRESTAVYDIERVLFVRPDVAVVNVRQRPVRWDGTPLADAPEGRPFYVLAKDAGTWRIAAAQNTQVVTG